MHAWKVSRVHDMDMGRIIEFAGTGAGVGAAIPLNFLLPLYLFTASSLLNHHLHFQLQLPSNCI
jgi:hypothetical protein